VVMRRDDKGIAGTQRGIIWVGCSQKQCLNMMYCNNTIK